MFLQSGTVTLTLSLLVANFVLPAWNYLQNRLTESKVRVKSGRL